MQRGYSAGYTDVLIKLAGLSALSKLKVPQLKPPKLVAKITAAPNESGGLLSALKNVAPAKPSSAL